MFPWESNYHWLNFHREKYFLCSKQSTFRVPLFYTCRFINTYREHVCCGFRDVRHYKGDYSLQTGQQPISKEKEFILHHLQVESYANHESRKGGRQSRVLLGWRHSAGSMPGGTPSVHIETYL